jgi:hypothetical protein
MYALSCGWSGLAHPVRAANNHALAIFQSRLTDSGEIPMTSPVSSILKRRSNEALLREFGEHRS